MGKTRKSESEFLKNLFEALEGASINYAVMRNYASLPETAGDSDIDIFIRRADQEKAISVVEEVVRQAGAVLIGISSASGLNKLCVLGRPSSSWWGVRLDFLASMRYGGYANLLDEDVLTNQIFRHRGVWVLEKEVAAASGLLKDLLYQAKTDDRYVRDLESLDGEGWAQIQESMRPIGKQAYSLLKQVAMDPEKGASLAPLVRKSISMHAYRTNPLKALIDHVGYGLGLIRRMIWPSGRVVLLTGGDVGRRAIFWGDISFPLDRATHRGAKFREVRASPLSVLKLYWMRLRKSVASAPKVEILAADSTLGFRFLPSPLFHYDLDGEEGSRDDFLEKMANALEKKQ